MDSLTIGVLLAAAGSVLGIVTQVVNLRKSSNERAARDTKNDVVQEAILKDMGEIKNALAKISEQDVNWRLFQQRVELFIEDAESRIRKLEKK
jgi:hypothetical protein